MFKIYEREKESENFKKEKYYQLETDISDSKCNSISFPYKKKFKKEDLNSPQAKNILSLKSIKLKKIDENTCIKKPPKLFNLSDLKKFYLRNLVFNGKYSNLIKEK
ncbi:DNA topoisomerase [Fusobacterium sp. FSA-380-WT-3A]|uniref:DNA topoisomerase n=1 Tax=Fusobacterium sp. FSA-380-WT-3A TaxID=2725304 RepID=UPI00351A3069